MSKSVLLIGGSGFLGSALQRALAHHPSLTVHAPDRDTLDLLNVDHCRDIQQYDVVINLTGQVSDPIEECEKLNTDGIRNLIAAIKDHPTVLVQLSTVAVYGTVDAVQEDSPLNPETPYAQCKADAEAAIQSSLLPDQFLIVRLANLYGSDQKKGLLWYLFNCIRSDETITISDNDGELRRSFLHADDAARMLWMLIERDARGTVNLPGPAQHSIREIVTLCEEIIKQPVAITYGTYPPQGNIGHISTDTLERSIPVKYEHSLQQYLHENLL